MELQSNLIHVNKWLIIANFFVISVLILFAVSNYLRWHFRVKTNLKYQSLSDKTSEANGKLLKKIALLEKQNKDLKETSNYLKDNAHNIGMQIAIEMFACKNVYELDEYLISLTNKKLEEYHPLTHYKTLKVLEENIPNLDKENLIQTHEEMSSAEELEKIKDMEVKDAIHEQSQDYSEETAEYNRLLSEQDASNLKTQQSAKPAPLRKLCKCMKPNPNPSGICQNCMNPIK